MRILHFLTAINLADGGVVRAVLDLCPAMAAAGHPVTLATCDDRDVPAPWRTGDASPNAASPLPRVLNLGTPGKLARLRADQRLALARAIENADVVHIHAMWQPANDQCASLCGRANKPYVISPHGMLDDWSMAQRSLKKRAYLRLIASGSLARAGAVHCTAQAERDQASRWFDPAKAIVVPLLLDMDPYRALPGPELARHDFKLDPSIGPVLLFLSRLHPKKGIEPLLHAAAALRSAGRRFSLVIAGTGDEAYTASLKSLARELKLEGVCSFPGFVSGQPKLSLYQASELFVLPSSQENFGFVIVEAMACAVPVLTTKGVALWPDVERARAGRIVEPRAETLAASIGALLDNPAELRAMGERGRAWCLDEFDPSRTVARYLEMYQRAGAPDNPPRRNPDAESDAQRTALR